MKGMNCSDLHARSLLYMHTFSQPYWFDKGLLRQRFSSSHRTCVITFKASGAQFFPELYLHNTTDVSEIAQV